MYTITNTTKFYISQTVAQYGNQVRYVPTPYCNDLFATESDDYKKLMVELNVASQHLLIEMGRMSGIDRKLTTKEHTELLKLFDRQIAAQSALQRHLHTHYDGGEYVG